MSYEDEIAFLMDAVKRLSRPIGEGLRNAPDAESFASVAERPITPPDADQANAPQLSKA
jgi:hypothetical protein